MTRRKKIILSLVVGVPVLGFAAALIYLQYADLSGWRDTVARLVSSSIGRELRINGDFHPEIGLTTRVTASDVTLANPEWSDDQHMVAVDRLDASIDLLSILSGPITIRGVKIAGARVLFETADDGEFNWDFRPGQPSGPPGPDVELVITDAELEDIRLVYSRPDNQPLEAQIERLGFTDDGTGMLDLELDGTIMKSPFEISGRLGTFIGLINASAVEHDLEGRIADTEFSSRGAIEDLASLAGIRGSVSIVGPDLAQTLSVLGFERKFDGPFRLTASATPAPEGSEIELEGSVEGITTKITGTVDSVFRPKILDATVTASGPSIRAVGSLTGITDLPDEEFSVSGGVRWEGFPVTFKRVEITVGKNSLSADGVLGAPPLMMGTDFSLQGQGPDISVIGALAGIDLPHDRFSVTGRVVRVDGGLEVENLEARIGRAVITANGLVGDPPDYAGTTLSIHTRGPNIAIFNDLMGIKLPAEAFSIDGRLAGGEQAITLEGVSARLGRNILRVEGLLKTEKGLSGTNLRIEARGPNATQIRVLTGLADLPKEAWTIAGRLAVLDSGYRLDGVSVTVGSLQADGGGRVSAARGLAGTDLQLHIEDPDLSHAMSIFGVNGFPQVPLRADGRLRVVRDGYRLDGVTASAGDIDVAVEGLIGATSNLDGTMGHVSVHGPRLSSLGPYFRQPGLPTAPFSVAGDLHINNGSYELGNVVVEVDHNRVNIHGTLLPAKGLVGTDLQIEAVVPDLGQAGLLVDGLTSLPELPAEPFTLSTQLRIDEAGYQIDGLEATLARAEVTIDGRIGTPPDLVGTDLRISGDGSNASLFTTVTGVTIPVAPFKITGRVQRTEDLFIFDRVAIRLGGHAVDLHGSLGEKPHLIGTDLELHVSGPGTGLIAELTGFHKMPDEPFKIAGRFHGTPELFTAEGLEIVVGVSDLKGSLDVDIRGKPAITAQMTSNNLDLAPYLPRRSGQKDQEADTAVASAPSEIRPVFSDTPINFGWLQRADADLEISIGALHLPAKHFRDVEFGARLKQGRLDVHRFAMVGQRKGRGSGTLVLEPIGDGYRFKTVLDFDALRLDPSGDSAADPASQPPFNLEVRLQAQGQSPHEFATSADGFVQIVIGKGVMNTAILDQITADILVTLLDAFNPFSKNDGASELQCGVALVTFENGLAKLEPMALQSDKMTMLGKGLVDLDTEKLDLEWITKPRKGIGISASMITNPYIKLGGTLSSPAIELKPIQAAASTGVAVATMGISLVAKGMFDRVTAERKVCKRALEEIAEARQEN